MSFSPGELLRKQARLTFYQIHGYHPDRKDIDMMVPPEGFLGLVSYGSWEGYLQAGSTSDVAPVAFEGERANEVTAREEEIPAEEKPEAKSTDEPKAGTAGEECPRPVGRDCQSSSASKLCTGALKPSVLRHLFFFGPKKQLH